VICEPNAKLIERSGLLASITPKRSIRYSIHKRDTTPHRNHNQDGHSRITHIIPNIYTQTWHGCVDTSGGVVKHKVSIAHVIIPIFAEKYPYLLKNFLEVFHIRVVVCVDQRLNIRGKVRSNRHIYYIFVLINILINIFIFFSASFSHFKKNKYLYILRSLYIINHYHDFINVTEFHTIPATLE
jgi:hypothetical protein